MRKKIVAGNWKMNKLLPEAVSLVKDIGNNLESLMLPASHHLIVCPPYLYLSALNSYLEISNLKEKIALGAQNCHQETKGAYTGEIAASMLAQLQIPYVLIGHSERRAYFGENSTLLKEKVNQALAVGLQPIFCCGEPLKVRESGKHFEMVSQQLEESLFHLSTDEMKRIVIAYEPVWAIGTGVTASPEQAEEMHQHIRQLLHQKYDATLADQTTLLYGGSCKPSNADALFACPNVDGGLIGGASLKADSFVAIMEALIKAS